MELFVGIKIPEMEVIAIADREPDVTAAIAAVDNHDGQSQYLIKRSPNIIFSSAGKASISMEYEMDCLEEQICLQLADVDTDAPEAQEVVGSIVGTAYHDITHYGVTEEYAIAEAIKAHSAEIQGLKGEGWLREAIRDYMIFEEETSLNYPFPLTYDELSEDTISAIEARCGGDDDTETVHEAICAVIGEIK